MSNKLSTYGLDALDRWQSFYDRLETGGPYHSPEYIQHITGHLGEESTARLAVMENDQNLVYYPYLVRPVKEFETANGSHLSEHSDIVASWYYGGPIFEGETSDFTARFVERFTDHCTSEGIVAEFIRFDPNLRNHLSFPSLDPTLERETVWVDLEQSEEDIWDGFEKRNRNAIRQAQETTISIEPTSAADHINQFYEIYASAMEAKDASEHYRFSNEFFQTLLANRDLASLLIARYEGTTIGGAVLVHDERIAHDYLRASNPDYWDMRVNNLLCYRALLYARERGCEVFDFQGGRPGVFNFKKSFSPDRGEFHIAKRIHMPDVYAELVEAAASSGIDTDTAYFPAYRAAKSN